MEIDRRSLVKGLLAGGALLALGTPSWTFADQPVRKAKRCLLFLGDSGIDQAFEKGVREACAEVGYDGLEMLKVNGGLLSNPDRMVELLEQSGGARWIAVMDDASAAVFQELARTSGGRLLSVGSHASMNDHACSLRHTWLVASPAQGVGGLLAAQTTRSGVGFSITESFITPSSVADELTGWSAPGFSSYRSVESESMHLHCSGLSLSEGCGELGLTGAEGWAPIPPHVCQREVPSRPSQNWVESVGYAVAASALGVHSIQESCSTRAFVHRTGGLDERIVSSARLVSFVMDI